MGGKNRVFLFIRAFLQGYIGRLNGAILGEFFEVFFRSLSTRDGFLTIPNDDLAGFTPGTCVFARSFVPFNPFMVERKVPFLVPLQCSLSLCIGGLYIKAMLKVNFSKFFPVPFALRMDS